MQTNDFSNLPKSWQIKTLGECLDYEQPTKYIVKSTKYDDSYKTPVLTAGKSFILGYTDELEGIFTQIPVIIFDDFTTDTKFVDFKFKVKSSAMKILHSKENADIKFIYYFMQTIRHRSDTHKRYWISEYAKLKIPLPPIETQKRIVARLESAFEKIEKGSAHLQDAKIKLAKYKQSLLKSAFDGTLTATASLQGVEKAETIHTAASLRASVESVAIHNKSVDCHDLTSSNLAMTDKENPKLPQGWTVKTLGEIGEIVTGSTPNTKNREYYGDEYPFYKPTDLNLGYCVENSSDMVSSKGFEISRKLPSKSILVTCIGATIGKTGLIRSAGICNQQINAIIPKQNICPEFVYFYCISNVMQELIKTNASATTIPILNKTAFSKLPIPLPPLETQKQIVKLLERHFECADKTDKFIESALNKAKQLKQSLLKSAFLGELTQ